MRRARLPARRRGKGEGIVVSGQKRVNGRFRLPGRQRQPAVDPPDDRYTIFMKTPRRQLLGLAVLAALAFAGCGDDKPSRAEPGIWLAITSPGPLERPVGHAAPLRVFNAVTGQERSFGPAARYVVVAWAPRGDRLAAFGVEDPTAEDAALVIRIWDAGGDVVATTRSTAAMGATCRRHRLVARRDAPSGPDERRLHPPRCEGQTRRGRLRHTAWHRL